MAKKNFSGMLEESLNGRVNTEKNIKTETPEDKEPEVEEVTKDKEVKAEDTKEEPSEQKLNLIKLEPEPSELLTSGIVIAGKRGAIRVARTVNFEEDLLKKIEDIAKDHHISFSAVINQILRQVL